MSLISSIIIQGSNVYIWCFFSGGFLSEAGWFSDSEKVYQVCLDAMHSDHSEAGLWRAMEYCVRLVISF